MDSFVVNKGARNSPLMALLNFETGEVRNVAPPRPVPKPAEEEDAKKKRKQTEVSKASEKRRKEHEKNEKRVKAQQKNGVRFGKDGKLEQVERPWKAYAKRMQGTRNNNTKFEKKLERSDRTLIGQMEKNSAAMDSVKTCISPLLTMKEGSERLAKEAAPAEVKPEHDHHPFLCCTTPVLPPSKQCAEIVSKEAEMIAEAKLSEPALREACNDLFHTILRLTREDLNACHACLAQKFHISKQYDENRKRVASEVAAPHEALREMAEVKRKRVEQANSDHTEIKSVVREAFDSKMRDIVQRCVAGSLLRPSAQELAPRELYVYYKEFMKERSEVKLLDKIVALLLRDEQQ